MDRKPLDYVNMVITGAAVLRPAQLRQKALMAIQSFMFQHQCLLTEGFTMLDQAIEDRALEEQRTELLCYLNTLVADLRQLELVYDTLLAVDADFERASPGAVEATAETLRDDALANCQNGDTEVARAVFERLLSQPNPTRSNDPRDPS